ncbi:hypothetical protein CTI12_AA250040 [Artemisia annua]|uniref:Uncharacterized protein n=1 Tax=Artemisia annua TaxID=35608 RepID=A0A2U1NMH1_ARTAN|nr:hypothetical protein CTI12_AA250040 [Artemisia annua]
MDLLADGSTFLWLSAIEKIEYLQRLIMHIPGLNYRAKALSELHRSRMLENDDEFSELEQWRALFEVLVAGSNYD